MNVFPNYPNIIKGIMV